MNERQEQQWFSSKIRLVCLIEGSDATRYQDSVFLFRAYDFEDGFQRALELGRACEESYVNPDNKQVRWLLKEIISLDVVAANQLDGVEVYSEPVPLEDGVEIPFDATFAPETSRPTQTI